MRSLNIRFVLVVVMALSCLPGLAQESKLLPDFAVLQYAGSIGYFSGGIGYNMYKTKARLSAHYGHVPASEGGRLHVLSAKYMKVPWVARISDNMIIRPIDFGVIISYHTGDGFKSNVPNYFEKNYYWWHTNLRFHIATEHSLTVVLPQDNLFKSISGYVEFNLNDLYLVSYATNTSSLRLDELVKAGAGIRLAF